MGVAPTLHAGLFGRLGAEEPAGGAEPCGGMGLGSCSAAAGLGPVGCPGSPLVLAPTLQREPLASRPGGWPESSAAADLGHAEGSSCFLGSPAASLATEQGELRPGGMPDWGAGDLATTQGSELSDGALLEACFAVESRLTAGAPPEPGLVEVPACWAAMSSDADDMELADAAFTEEPDCP